MDRTTADSFWETILVNKSSRTDITRIGIGSPIILSIILLCVLLFIQGTGIILEVRCAYLNGLARGSGP